MITADKARKISEMQPLFKISLERIGSAIEDACKVGIQHITIKIEGLSQVEKDSIINCLHAYGYNVVVCHRILFQYCMEYDEIKITW